MKVFGRHAPLCLAMLALAASQAVLAKQFTVDAVTDGADANPGDGICANSVGECSLRAAVMESNALEGSDIISLQATTYVLNAGTSEDDDIAVGGDLDITDHLSIVGQGMENTVISGGSQFRVLDVFKLDEDDAVQPTVSVESLTIQEGPAELDEGSLIRNSSELTLKSVRVTLGGNDTRAMYNESATADVKIESSEFIENELGIYNDSNVRMKIADSNFSDNTTDKNFDGIAISGRGRTLDIANTTFARNTSSHYNSDGMAIHKSYGYLEISESSFISNGNTSENYRTNSVGGALYLFRVDTTFSDVLFESNFGGHGGALYSYSSNVFLEATLFTDNSAEGNGGAIYNYGSALKSLHSEYSSNNAEKNGGAYFGYLSSSTLDYENIRFSKNSAGDRGGAIYSDGRIAIDGSLFDANAADYGAGFYLASSENSTINNSAISGNSANYEGGGIYLTKSEGEAYFRFSTFHNNSANSDGANIFTASEGLRLQGSVVGSPRTSNSCAGTFESSDYNLLDPTCASGNLKSHDATADPSLSVLADNGGDYPSVALNDGSTAISMVPATYCPSVDQRYFLRTRNADCDAGSFQTYASAATPGDVGFALATKRIGEQKATLELSLTRTGGSDGTVTVDVYDRVGTAADGNYDLTDTTLTWTHGDTAAKTYPLELKTAYGNQGFTTVDLGLRNLTGNAGLGANPTMEITIIDSEASPSLLGFDEASATVAEDSAYQATVIRTASATGVVSVDYATMDDTAVAGDDYLPTSGTLTFANGETEKTITVQILPDSDEQLGTEADESFIVALSNPQGESSLGSIEQMTILIPGDGSDASVDTSGGSGGSSDDDSTSSGSGGSSSTSDTSSSSDSGGGGGAIGALLTTLLLGTFLRRRTA